eukprot:5719387-Karenia_brevis.AAC.1
MYPLPAPSLSNHNVTPPPARKAATLPLAGNAATPPLAGNATTPARPGYAAGNHNVDWGVPDPYTQPS